MIRDTPIPIEPRLDHCNHSPMGFECRYGGDGPGEVDLAIPADCVDDDVAISYHQAFTWKVVSKLDENEWQITGTEVIEALEKIAKED